MHPSLYSPCASTHPWYHSSAPLTLFPMYPSQDQDYPSPAPSDPSHSSQQPDQHQNQGSFGQIDSSIGPSRVSRRPTSLKCLPVRRVSLSLNYARPEDVCLRPPYFIDLCSLTRLGSITGCHRAASRFSFDWDRPCRFSACALGPVTLPPKYIIVYGLPLFLF